MRSKVRTYILSIYVVEHEKQALVPTYARVHTSTCDSFMRKAFITQTCRVLLLY